MIGQGGQTCTAGSPPRSPSWHPVCPFLLNPCCKLQEDIMNRSLIWISGLGFGAGLMYLLDPDRGRRRRTLLRDRAVRAVNRVGHFLDATRRDVSHRAQGLAAEACSLFTGEDVPDEVLM